MKAEIYLCDGGSFNYVEPDKSNYTIRDVARHLSREPRFCGATGKTYTVAQHSVYTSLIIPEEFAMEGLMHDSGEAFMKDIPTPFKQLLKDYKKFEKRGEASIFKKYGLKYPMHPEVKKADQRMFLSERLDLQPGADVSDYSHVERVSFKIVPWGSEKAEREFLKRYFELGGVEK